MTARPPDRPTPKPGILDIVAYKPGRASAEGVAQPVKLSANENILGSSDAARAAFAAAADRLHLYPDGQTTLVRNAVAQRYDLEPERLMFGCGSDELFPLLCQVYLQPGDNVVQGEFAFLTYGICARANQAEVRSAPERDYTVDVDAMLACVDDRTRIVFLTNPSNPTGTYISAAEVRRLHAGLPSDVLLIHDGAYAEYVEAEDYDDGLALAREHANVVATRTFSKIHGLCALRIGWGYADVAIVDAVERIRPPFNTTIPAQEAAVAALADRDFERRSVEHVGHWRPWLSEQITAMGFPVVPSAANFVLVRFPDPDRSAPAAEAFLASRGLLVRGVGSYGLPDCLRITVGLEEHNRAVVGALAAFAQS